MRNYKVIKFNQNSWLKPYVDTNTDLRKKAKNDFEKYIFKLMGNAVLLKKSEKTYRCKTFENRKKREVFSIRTKFSYCKAFHRKVISNRIEQN